MSKVMYPVVRVDIWVCFVSVVIAEHIFVVEGGRRVRGTKPIAFRPLRHEMGKTRKTTVTAGSTVVRNGLIIVAVRGEDRYGKSTGVAWDEYCRWAAIMLAITLVIRPRDASEGCKDTGSLRVACQNNCRKSTTIRLSCCVDFVGVQTVDAGEVGQELERKVNIVIANSSRVALPLLIDTLRIDD